MLNSIQPRSSAIRAEKKEEFRYFLREEATAFGRNYNMANEIMLANIRSEIDYVITSCNVWEKKKRGWDEFCCLSV